MIRSTCLFFVAALTLSAQVDLTPKLQKGQKYVVELSTNRAGASATAFIDMAVLDTGAQGSKLSWTVRDTKLTAGSQPIHPIMKQLIEATRGFRLEFQLRPKGDFDRITNAPQVKQSMEKIAKNLTDQLAQTIPDETKRKQFTDMMAKAVRTDELIDATAKDAIMIFGLAGAEVKEGTPVKLKVKSPHPLGTGSIDSELSITLVKADKQKGEYVVRTAENYDPKSLTAATTALLGKVGATTKDKKAKLPQIEVHDTVDYTVDMGTNMPKTIVHKRVISSGGAVQRTDTKQLVLKRV